MQFNYMMIATIVSMTLVASSNGFWWGGAAREADPAPVVKQMPLGYFRAYTYQPMQFNPAVPQQFYAYPAATKMINPLQYVPQKAYTLSATYTGPLQAQQSVQQSTHEPSPITIISAPANSASAPPPAPAAASAPVASIAESLTSDAHLPVASVPMPQQQSAQPQQVPQQMQPQQQQQQQQPQLQQQQQFAPIPPVPAASPFQYSAAPSARLAQAPAPASYLAASISDQQQQLQQLQQQQQQQQYNVPYMMTGSAMPMQPVQFVPCMCPVSYAMPNTPEVAQANKRSDELLTTFAEYQPMENTATGVAGITNAPTEADLASAISV